MSRTDHRRAPTLFWRFVHRAGLKAQTHARLRAATRALRALVAQGGDPDEMPLPTRAREVSDPWSWD